MNRLARFGPILGLAIIAMVLLTLVPRAVPAAFAAGVSVSRSTVPQGATDSVSGSGFTAGDTVTISLSAPVSGHTQRIQTTATADSSGAFTAKLALPGAIAAGTYKVTAQDMHNNTSTVMLTVLPLLVLRAGGATHNTTVVDRTKFFVDVVGFSAGESVKVQGTFTAYNGNSIIESHTISVNSHGNAWNILLNAPNNAKAGQATVTAAGQTSNKQAQGHVNVVYRPSIYLTHSSVNSGSWITVNGRGFVSNAQVRVQINVPSNNGTTQTISVTASADGNGNFSKAIHLPSYVDAGSYTVTATDLTGGFKRFAKLTVTKPPAKRTLTASLSLLPSVTLPNQDITLVGTNFPANSNVTVTATIDLRGGGNRVITTNGVTGPQGGISVVVRVPWKAAPGTYTVTANVSGATASKSLQVLAMSSHPTTLNFHWISLWYHTVRQGTSDRVIIQSTLHTRLGIWVHVIFPSGRHIDFYEQTNGHGRWSTWFSVPHNSRTRHSNHAFITFQLWHGKHTTQHFMSFWLV